MADVIIKVRRSSRGEQLAALLMAAKLEALPKAARDRIYRQINRALDSAEASGRVRGVDAV